METRSRAAGAAAGLLYGHIAADSYGLPQTEVREDIALVSACRAFLSESHELLPAREALSLLQSWSLSTTPLRHSPSRITP